MKIKTLIQLLTLTIIFNTCSRSNDHPYKEDAGIRSKNISTCVVNHYLYSVQDNEMHIYGLSDPANPEQKAVLEMRSADIKGIVNFDHLLFVSSGSGLYIYDISDPVSPKFESTVTAVLCNDHLFVQGNNLFVSKNAKYVDETCTGSLNQLWVFDIADPSNPLTLKKYNFSSPHDMTFYGGYLFMCDAGSGLTILNIDDVENIYKVKQVTYERGTEIEVKGKIMTVSDHTSVSIYDCFDPLNIVKISSIQ